MKCSTLERSRFWNLAIIAAVCVLAGCRAAAPNGSQPAADRVLVVIVPGTYGNASFWPMPKDGQATFGSELKDALPPGSDIEPIIWTSSIFHAGRANAAKTLAKVIDTKAADFDRVCIVAHSHGGNIALLALGQCQTDVDMLVCLGTPHAYLRTVNGDMQGLDLPIYCSPSACKRVRSIIAVSADTDAVPEFWSNELLTGLRENEAIDLTRDWREQHGHPRLQRDSFLVRLFESGNIFASSQLNMADENIRVHSQVKDLLGIKAHQTLHSRRMGEVIGQLIRDGAEPDDMVVYLKSLVQPADADTGEPVLAATHQAWRERHANQFKQSGWLLEQARVELDAGATAVANDLDGSLPDPMLCLFLGDNKRAAAQTAARKNKMEAEWQPGFYVRQGQRFALAVYDDNLIGNTSLGVQWFEPAASPPTTISADPAHGRYWSAELKWAEAHY